MDNAGVCEEHRLYEMKVGDKTGVRSLAIFFNSKV